MAGMGCSVNQLAATEQWRVPPLRYHEGKRMQIIAATCLLPWTTYSESEELYEACVCMQLCANALTGSPKNGW
eukprot:12239271-Alexandrium_andersonii.AAC.1